MFHSREASHFLQEVAHLLTVYELTTVCSQTRAKTAMLRGVFVDLLKGVAVVGGIDKVFEICASEGRTNYAE